MPEIIHGEPREQSIVETHLGIKPIDTSELGPIKIEPGETTRDKLKDIGGVPYAAIDKMLDVLIARARPESALASLFLKRVKEGRA